MQYDVLRPLSKSILNLNRVASGEASADLLLRNCSLVSVYTNEILAGMDIAVYGGRIAYVGPDGSHTAGKQTRTEDLSGRYVTPGFADPHTHIDQFVTPAELAGRLLLHGTTSIFSDPIDMVSVGGYRGFAEFVKMTERLPVRFFHMIPGGLPVDRRFSSGKFMTPSQEKAALRHPNVLGMGEVFSWVKVVMRDPGTFRSLSAMLEGDCTINGHTAGASGKKLNAYVSSGILSCHEPVDHTQVLERLRLGMWVMMREGSIRRDLKNIIPGILSCKAYLDRLMFCSDGVSPADIEAFGHIDHCIREAVRLGVKPVDAITMASKNCFDYYGMGKDLGGIAPGKLADMLVLDELESVRPSDVYVGGVRAVTRGKLSSPIRAPRVPAWLKKTVRLKRLAGRDFEVRARGSEAHVNTILMDTEIITKRSTADLPIRDGNVCASAERDVWKVAAFERIFGTGKRTVGFLENFGADIGAFASTWSFHENDMIVIGSDESDMATAANALSGAGGMALVRDGKTLVMPLELAGIASMESFEDAASGFARISHSITDAGCKFGQPHMIPLFLPFLALPSVRILHRGLIDVKSRTRIPTIPK